ncbi:Reverse transcriptase zinc-binding domain [Thalictrum thalictroides]|uniref:Reverse transcriptase zinc-binding domain n=1 Tax=Thalictrum thalictroides TaxID=46969 RepID=A0A7J6UQZ5_THATH|nr:Reverse transcriptase zinc-binding domain [Thalictrum thalictroides]
MQDLTAALTPLYLEDGRDSWSWRWTKNKEFSVKSMYIAFLNRDMEYSPPLEEFPYKVVWEVSIPTNVKLFIWALVWESVLTVDNLNSQGFCIPNRCVLCKRSKETIHHLFLSCPTAKLIWSDLTGHMARMNGIREHTSPRNMLLNWPTLNARGIGEATWSILPYVVLWVLWSVRNEIIFDNGVFERELVIKKVKCTIWGWLDVIGKSVDVKNDHTIAELLLNWENMVQRW